MLSSKIYSSRVSVFTSYRPNQFFRFLFIFWRSTSDFCLLFGYETDELRSAFQNVLGYSLLKISNQILNFSLMSRYDRMISCASNSTNDTESSWIFLQPPQDQPFTSLTKNVDQLVYKTPAKLRHTYYTPPEFLKVFGDMRIALGSRAVLDCMLIGNPRPKVTWLFNQYVIPLDDREILVKDTNDVCQLIIPKVADHHYGIYTVVAENEVGKAKCSGYLSRILYQSVVSTAMKYC